MTWIAGPFYAFALLLVAAGAGKLADPRATAGALQTAGLPSSFLIVRALGGAEIALGAAAITFGSWWSALLLALSYSGFAGFVAFAKARRLPIASCGCFGKSDTPPTVAHLAIAALAAFAGILVTAFPLGTFAAVVLDQPWAGVPFALATAVTTYLLYVILTDLARTSGRVAVGRQARGALR